MSSRFWDIWMVAVGWILVFFGLLLAFANQTWLFDVVFNQQVNAVFWSSPVAPESLLSFQRWIYGVLGMTVAGWGVFFVYVATYPFRRRERWAWNCVFAGITLSPGVTRTEFLEVAGQQPSLYQRTMMMESPAVTRSAIDALLSGKASVVPGFMNALLAESTRLMPRQLAAMSADRLMQI